MAEILILVPTRGRPQSIAPFMDAWDDTSTEHADVLFCLDDDDEKLQEYLKPIILSGAQYVVAPRMRLGGTLNHHAAHRAASYPYIGFLGDDHRMRTSQWDKRIVSELRVLRSGMVYGNDLMQGRNLPTAIVMTSNIISTLGFMVPAGLTHLYIDNAWKALGLGADCLVYMNDVIIEHMHPHAGKASNDERYVEVNSPEMYDEDSKKWIKYAEHGLAADVRKIHRLRMQAVAG